MGYLTLESVFAVFQSAMVAGNRPAIRDDGRAYRRTIKWDVSGRCKTPVVVTMWSRYHVSCKRGLPMGVELTTQCRKCGWCLMKRRNHWANAAVNEVHASSRTWFITLTGDPGFHHRMISSTRASLAAELPERVNGVLVQKDYDSLPHDKRFRELLRVLPRPAESYGREITLFLKRIRKNSCAQFRYLLVAERHKSGLPHFHMLLHEMGVPVRKAIIKAAWPNGFSKVQLCDGDRGAVYLCKYLAKEASTRVRASFKYGVNKHLNTHEMSNESVKNSDPQETFLPEEGDGFPSLSRGYPFSGVVSGRLSIMDEQSHGKHDSETDRSGSSPYDETTALQQGLLEASSSEAWPF